MLFISRNSHREEISISKLSIGTNYSAYNDTLVTTKQIILPPESVTEVSLTFSPNIDTVGMTVKVIFNCAVCLINIYLVYLKTLMII